MGENLNILITGDLSSHVECLARKFSKEGHKVVLAGPDPKVLTEKIHRVTFHSIAVDDALFKKTLSSYGFNFVIFIGTREECLDGAMNLSSGEMIDGVTNALELAKDEKLEHFCFISSTEISRKSPESEETADINPISVNGYALASAEELCSYYHEQYSLSITICRVPHVYGANSGNTLVSHLLDEFSRKSKIILPASRETKISLLHCSDIADFLMLIMREPAGEELRIFNLSAIKPILLGDLANLINDYFPGATFIDNAEGVILTKYIDSSKAESEFGWTPKRILKVELAEYLESWKATPPEKTTLWERLGVLNPLIRWAELFIGAGVVYLLTNLTNTVLQFRYIDFRLLFIILLGATHGTGFGLLSAIMASGLALLSWYQDGMNFSMLIYNVENWIPFALYLLAGGISGYLHDKHENEVRFQQEQADLIQEKYKFLYGVYDEIGSIKDQFREQLMGYRDSFGRIYKVTTQLNSLQEEDIMLQALGVLEDLLDNDSIAIYSFDDNKVFGRLQVCSYSLTTTLPKSIRLSDFPEVVAKLEEGELFQNKDVKSGYPAYFSPVLDGDNTVAGIAIWDVKFDQFSLQYNNLIRVITGLIQSALVRAAQFRHANAQNMYLQNTRILKPEAFRDVLSAKKEMETSQVAEFEVLRVMSEIEDLQEASQLIEQGIRSTDYIGQLEDGHCYVLLSQTDWINAFNVLSRLYDLGIEGEICTEGVYDV